MRSIAVLPVVLTCLFSAVLLGPPAGAAAEEKKKAVTNVDAQSAAKLLKSGVPAGGKSDAKLTVIDVRTPKEFKDGHIKGAKNIDFKGDDFREKIAKLDPAKPYLINCRSGRRSTSSLKDFQKLGFTHLYHLDGGILGWEKAKQPVEK